MVKPQHAAHAAAQPRGPHASCTPIYRKRALDNYLRRGSCSRGSTPSRASRCIEFLAGRQGRRFHPGRSRARPSSWRATRPTAFTSSTWATSASRRPSPDGQRQVTRLPGPGRHVRRDRPAVDPRSPTVARMLPERRGPADGQTCTALDHVELVRDRRRRPSQALLQANPDVAPAAGRDGAASPGADRRAGRGGPARWASSPRQGLYQGQNLLVLDLNRCTRCQECVKACADSHGGVTRLVLEGNRFGEYLVPSACRSCHDPACLVGCPVDAIHRRPADPSRAAGSRWRSSSRTTASAAGCAATTARSAASTCTSCPAAGAGRAGQADRHQLRPVREPGRRAALRQPLPARRGPPAGRAGARPGPGAQSAGLKAAESISEAGVP